MSLLKRFDKLRYMVNPDFDLWFNESFQEALKDLNNNASVGKGVMGIYGADVKTALKFDGVSYDPVRVDLLKQLVRGRMKSVFRGTYEAHPINVFVKPEPHKLAKIAEGRFRLIMAVSLEDTMIDRMLYSPAMKLAVDHWTELPIKVGYSPLQGKFRLLKQAFPRGSMSTDKKAWDFSVKPWLVEMWRQFLEDLVGGGPSWWVELHRARFCSLYGPATLYEFADGSQAIQQYPGVMKSGCFNTLLLNSVGQVIMTEFANLRLGIPFPEYWAVGDDTVEEIPQDVEAYVRELENLGCAVKEVAVNKYVEFCGFLADSRKIVPSYWRKHVFNLLCDYDEYWVDKLQVYELFYAFQPAMLTFIHELERVVGIPPIPADILKAIWSGLY